MTTERDEREREAENAQILARQSIESARIHSDQTIEQERIRKEQALQSVEIERRKALELAEQQRAIAIALESKHHSEAQAQADHARAKAVEAEEKVFTTREVEIANRRKEIELIATQQDIERETMRIVQTAEAENTASTSRGLAIRAQAEAEADAEKIRAMAQKIRAEVEAEALSLMNHAHNTLSTEARASALRMRLVEKAEAIIRESVRPMERIEGIKIMHVDGLGISCDHGGGNHASQAVFAEGIVN